MKVNQAIPISHLTFRPFQGDNDFPCLAAIEAASENADCRLAVNISAADMAEHMSQIPRFDLFHA